MREIDFTADELTAFLLDQAANGRNVCILDSCGAEHPGSRLMIAGYEPVSVKELAPDNPMEVLDVLDRVIGGEQAAFFTLSYEFGAKLNGLDSDQQREPDLFLALFGSVVVHDYCSGKSYLAGTSEAQFNVQRQVPYPESTSPESVRATSNVSREAYIGSIRQIQEFIREGLTYQTNLTRQISVALPGNFRTEAAFWKLRKRHPSPYAAYLNRLDSTVISASPEMFARIDRRGDGAREIRVSPIKGTRPRGHSPEEDALLRSELLTSQKDMAENTMIVDLMRNDIGRVCKFGTVEAESLCAVAELPSLFHLVSTVRGELCEDAKFSSIIRAIFPCGSVTGAPKISTMQIIDRLEPANRGLSVGAIGCYIPSSFGWSRSVIQMSVAIRTAVVRNGEAVFNVGGGITIDSDPEAEFEETEIKARALLDAFGAR